MLECKKEAKWQKSTLKRLEIDIITYKYVLNKNIYKVIFHENHIFQHQHVSAGNFLFACHNHMSGDDVAQLMYYSTLAQK